MREYEIREGRKRLAEWLPAAKEKVTKGGMVSVVVSALGKTTAQYARFDNIDAIVIYEARSGGWHADLLFKETPHGVPNSMGTPVGQPCRTRAEAIEAGKHILDVVVVECLKNERGETPKAPPVFLYHGGSIELVPGLLEFLGKQSASYESKEHAYQRFVEIERELFPDGFSEEAVNRLPREDMIKLVSVCHMAALTGVFAYPPREPASPLSDTQH